MESGSPVIYDRSCDWGSLESGGEKTASPLCYPGAHLDFCEEDKQRRSAFQWGLGWLHGGGGVGALPCEVFASCVRVHWGRVVCSLGTPWEGSGDICHPDVPPIWRATSSFRAGDSYWTVLLRMHFEACPLQPIPQECISWNINWIILSPRLKLF